MMKHDANSACKVTEIWMFGAAEITTAALSDDFNVVRCRKNRIDAALISFSTDFDDC